MVTRFNNDRQRKAVMQKYNRSAGQFRRHHGTLTVGSELRKIPYFKVVDGIELLVATNPDKKDMILTAGRKIARQDNIREQNATYSALLKRLRA